MSKASSYRLFAWLYAGLAVFHVALLMPEFALGCVLAGLLCNIAADVLGALRS